MQELDEDRRIWWGKDGNNVPAIKRFLSEVKEGVIPQTLWFYDDVGHTQDAKKEIVDILDFEDSASVFSTPKPTRLLERILRIATNPGDTVLDFFAGSGTTAQALLKLNQEDNGGRRFILVSNTEATKETPDKNLCRDVCAERLRRAIRGYQSKTGKAVAGLGGDFAYLRVHTLPAHRLDDSENLADGMIWVTLQRLHDLPLIPWSRSSFGWRDHNKEAVAYLAHSRGRALDRLADKLAAFDGKVTVYSWAAGRVRQRFPELTVESLPEALLRGIQRDSPVAPIAFEEAAESPTAVVAS